MAKNNIEKKTLKNIKMKGVKSMEFKTYNKKVEDFGSITPEDILNSGRIIKFECDCGLEFFVDFTNFIKSKMNEKK